PVAQLDRVAASEAVGHRFESCRVRHFPKTCLKQVFLYLRLHYSEAPLDCRPPRTSAAFGCTRNGVSQTFALPCRVRHFPKAYLKQGHSSLSSRFNTLLNCQITVLLAFLRVLRLFTHRLIDQPCLPGPTMLPSI